jgi:hypothetical protein
VIRALKVTNAQVRWAGATKALQEICNAEDRAHQGHPRGRQSGAWWFV